MLSTVPSTLEHTISSSGLFFTRHLKQSEIFGSSLCCITRSLVHSPARENRPIPNVPATMPKIKNSCRISMPILPLFCRSMKMEITGPTRPPMAPEIRRAEVMTRLRSLGFGEMAADIPQKGISPMV